MKGEELIIIFKRYIDDSPDDETCLDLLNVVKDLVESDRPWRMLVKEDVSNTFGAGETYLTAKTLPSDFLYDIKLELGIESADDYVEYDPCGFEERRRFSNSRKYCTDITNSQFYICGSVSKTYTVYLYYIYETPAITLTIEPVWPEKFQRLIPLLMGEIWKGGIDTDIINLQQALRLSRPGMLLYQAMRRWDSSLKLRAMNHSTPIHGTRTGGAITGIVPDSDLL